MFFARFQSHKMLYYTALELFIMLQIVRSSLYDYIVPDLLRISIYYIVLFLLVLKWYIGEKYTGKKLLIWMGLFLIVSIIAIKNDYSSLLVIIAVILSGQDIDFDKNLKFTSFSLLFWSLFVICSCKMGFLQDYTYYHRIGATIRLAHSWGFKYYSSLGYLTMTLSSVYLYFNRDCSYFKLLLLFSLNILLFTIHTTNLSIAVTVMTILMYVFTVKLKWFQFRKRIWGFIAILFPIAMFLFTIWIVNMYATNNLRINVPFLRTIVSRLDFSVQAVKKYGFNWLGTHVEMYGNTAYHYGNADSSFYIDSGYVYMAIVYGIIFSIILIAFYSTLFHYIYRRRDAFMYAWLAIILIASCVNNFILSLIYNPLLFLLPKALFEFHKTKGYTNYKMIDIDESNPDR